MTDDALRQMQAQMNYADEFRSVSAVALPIFQRETRLLLPTPYTALYVEPCARAHVAKNIGPTAHPVLHGDVIPYCYFGSNPEIVSPWRAVATGIVATENIEIVLCEINNKVHRKDGIPYHMIWSVSPELATLPVVEDTYRWPVYTAQPDFSEISPEISQLPVSSSIETRSYARAISRAGLAAEALAAHAGENPLLVRPLNIFVGTKSPLGDQWTLPSTMMITHEECFGGRRRATGIHLDY